MIVTSQPATASAPALAGAEASGNTLAGAFEQLIATLLTGAPSTVAASEGETSEEATTEGTEQADSVEPAADPVTPASIQWPASTLLPTSLPVEASWSPPAPEHSPLADEGEPAVALESRSSDQDLRTDINVRAPATEWTAPVAANQKDVSIETASTIVTTAPVETTLETTPTDPPAPAGKLPSATNAPLPGMDGSVLPAKAPQPDSAGPGRSVEASGIVRPEHRFSTRVPRQQSTDAAAPTPKSEALTPADPMTKTPPATSTAAELSVRVGTRLASTARQGLQLPTQDEAVPQTVHAAESTAAAPRPREVMPSVLEPRAQTDVQPKEQATADAAPRADGNITAKRGISAGPSPITTAPPPDAVTAGTATEIAVPPAEAAPVPQATSATAQQPTTHPASLRSPVETSRVPEVAVSEIQGLRRSGQEQTRLILRLDPPELGSVRLELRTLGDQVLVAARAESPEAVRALMGQHSDLRAAIEALGLALTTFDVQSGPDQGPQQRWSLGGRPGHSSATRQDQPNLDSEPQETEVEQNEGALFL